MIAKGLNVKCKKRWSESLENVVIVSLIKSENIRGLC